MAYYDFTAAELRNRADRALALLENCTVCARRCRVNRLEGERGFCRAGRKAVVSSYGPHFGEEDVLVGRHGSGTIFFTFCNLGCCFCQNYEISHYGEGQEVDAQKLAGIMLALQDMGCHNINFVSPSHFVPQILEALVLAVEDGLKIPLVYNTGGYDAIATLVLLDGIVDIYMPDIKFSGRDSAGKYAGVPDYFDVVRAAVKEMHRQVGDLEVDERGIARRGLLVRHLVLPGDLAGTERVMKFLAEEISPHTYVNIMGQYYPAYEASKYPELCRRITGEELRRATETARKAGLTRII